MANDINRITLTARLTQDPKLFTTDNGFAITTLRIVTNTSRKDAESGKFVDKANYFDVKVLGKQGENASKYLKKGSQLAVDGRLEWREFTTANGDARQAVEIVVDLSGTVRFLSSPKDSSESVSEDAGDYESIPSNDEDAPF